MGHTGRIRVLIRAFFLQFESDTWHALCHQPNIYMQARRIIDLSCNVIIIPKPRANFVPILHDQHNGVDDVEDDPYRCT